MPRAIYATLDELRGRVREEVLIALLDFDGDGEPDEDKFLTLIAYPACADLDRQLGGIFPAHIPFDAPPDTPDNIRELALDWYMHRLGTMYPSHVHIEVPALWAKIQSDMKRLREGKDVLGTKPPDPARNTGGTVGAIGDSPPITPPPSQFDDMGDFAPS